MLLVLLTLISASASADCHTLFPIPHFTDGSVLSLSAHPSPHASRTYAILLWGAETGEARAPKNYHAYWNSLSFGFTTLLHRGVPRENISVLVGNPGNTPAILTPERQPYPWDFDCDGRDDVTHPGTLEGLESAIQSLIPRLRGGDQVLFYYIGHGTVPILGLTPYHLAMAGPDLEIATLTNLLNRIPPNITTAVLIDSCYSGRTQQLTESSPERCVVSGATADTESWSSNSAAGFSDVSELMFSSWAGGRGYPAGRVPERFRNDIYYWNPDANGNRAVSMQEAFAFTSSFSTLSTPTSTLDLSAFDSVNGLRLLSRLMEDRSTTRREAPPVDDQDLPAFDRSGLVRRAAHHLNGRAERSACGRFSL